MEYAAPVEEQILTISTPNALSGIPVTAGGTYIDENGQSWIADEIDFDKGVHIQRVHRVRLTSTSHVWGTTTTAGRYTTNSPQPAMLKGYAPLCSHFVGRTSVTTTVGVVINNVGTQLVFSTGIASLAEWKAWLDANEVYLIYALATEIETPLADSLMVSYKNLKTVPSYMSITNEETAYLDISYPTIRAKDIEKVVHAGVLPIKSGGTGAITPIAARENLLIIVSETAPENPVEGMLWFDIS